MLTRRAGAIHLADVVGTLWSMAEQCKRALLQAQPPSPLTPLRGVILIVRSTMRILVSYSLIFMLDPLLGINLLPVPRYTFCSFKAIAVTTLSQFVCIAALLAHARNMSLYWVSWSDRSLN